MDREARKIVLTGRVQGVGYRPFVYTTARELGLAGTVLNGSGKVFIHAEGPAAALDRLEHALVEAAPPLARPRLASSQRVEPVGAVAFEILASDAAGEAEIHVPPDLFTCDDCLAELTGQGERRFGYPFINCTQCGPRYTIITAMPYDRPNTSMADFPLCDDCRAEYESPHDRRFHAQPLACPVCGPHLHFDPVGAAVGAALAAKGAPDTLHDIAPVGAALAAKGAPGTLHDIAPVGAALAAKGAPGTPKTIADVGAALAAKGAPGTPKTIVAEAAPTTAAPTEETPLDQTVAALEAGQVVAVKGVGGYHLVCDAANDNAVRSLRERKRRPHKPLAVMFPLLGEDGLGAMREHLQLDEMTAAAVVDPARPIVLARKTEPFRLSERLAPGLAELGAFLPYSPLHHQLLAAFGRPLVATSGNISGEPVITDEGEAQRRLAGIVDAFLHHDRPIVRPADDPVVRPMAGRARTIRLGRGLAPLERELPERLPRPVLAAGGHMKVTVALAWERRVVISPHVGELDSPRSYEVFQRIINDVQALYSVDCEAIACDLHPGYASTRWAEGQGLPLIRVQHHAAHASALAGEHPDVADWLVFAWDGVGYGSDGTLWGGEALAGRPGNWQRRASFRPFRVVGGDKAGREPWRSAAALMWAEDWDVGAALAANRAPDNPNIIAAKAAPTAANVYGESDIPSRLKPLLHQDALHLAHHAWRQRINTFETSAAGRLFDAAAALVLGRRFASFEGQGPMELEHVARDGCEALTLPLAPDDEGVLRSDWAPLLPVLTDADLAAGERAGIFHETMARAVLDQALKIRRQTRYDAVGLSGGVFQNRRLTERVAALLGDAGIDVRLHEEVPANDGGLCFGQAIEAMAKL
jgi:hydrogenase maturation protein HypF